MTDEDWNEATSVTQVAAPDTIPAPPPSDAIHEKPTEPARCPECLWLSMVGHHHGCRFASASEQRGFGVRTGNSCTLCGMLDGDHDAACPSSNAVSP